MIKNIIKKSILPALRHAEKEIGKGNGQQKLILATKKVMQNHKFLFFCGKLVSRAISEEFEEYREQINRQIMTEARII